MWAGCVSGLMMSTINNRETQPNAKAASGKPQRRFDMDMGILFMLKVERDIEYQRQVGYQPVEQYRFSLGQPQKIAKTTASKEKSSPKSQGTFIRTVEQCC
jgi:hypothetical protein